MRILHVITLAELGGAQSVVINLTERSVQDNDEVFVASSEHGEMWDVLHEKVYQIKIKSLKHSLGLADFIVLKELYSIYKSLKPDVVHLHSSKIGILGRLVFPSSKIIYTIHGFDSIRVRYRKFLPLEKILKSRCRAIVGVSNYDLENLKSEGIVNNIHKIQNGIKDFAHDNDDTHEDLFADFRQSEDTKVILSIARLAPPKRFDIFCQLADKFLDQDVIFAWIGNKTPEKNIPKNVILFGEKKDAFRHYRNADIAVLFSNYEGLPMSLIEALCFSKPIVASDVGGISELIDGNGAVAANDDLHKMQKTITFMLNNQNIYDKFAEQSRNIFEDKFNVDVMYNKYKELYSVIAKK
ncbi:glycosyltransferase [Chryseobacterium caseinilyticum]|uniref:Glycosyltransferase n=1 Tax=Chryseobacterium caseinilyticum TaxID=2771428 RepID=A0ABR8ZA85_9FLAO|nr:glycosyltransferase [Chryseobacterium caseinilyticum]MBD8082223.1 glycosyltransferase [Chryseobacterium caseinilyticum]